MVSEGQSNATAAKAAAGGHREAAGVILVRFAPALEVFWVLRSPELAYLGGFHAFPGGRVSRRDATVPVAGLAEPAEIARRAAAARETFEETGVLLATPSGGARAPTPAERAELRGHGDLAEARFADFLERHGLAVDGAALHPAGRWVSPPFSPRGFDTRFYLASLPDGESCEVVPGELAEGEWIEPSAAWQRWRRGECLLATPTKWALQVLARAQAQAPTDAGTLAAWARELADSSEARGGAVEHIEVTPGAVLLPLATPTLRPATHTNCLFLGEGEYLIVDPGSAEAEAQQAIAASVARLAREGRSPKAITVTHHHRDHTGGVEALRRSLGVPVWTHPLLAEELGAERELADGEALELAVPGARPWKIEVLFAPGHTKDHLVLVERERGVMAAGDLYSGLSTTVIDPPDGDLGEYLASVARLAALEPRVLFPGHGPPTGGGRPHLEKLLQHRRWREQRVLAALSRDAESIEALIPRVYQDVPAEQWPLARRSLLAHLLHLESGGHVRRERNPAVRPGVEPGARGEQGTTEESLLWRLTGR